MKAPLEVIKICIEEALKKIAGEYESATGLITEVSENIIEGKYKEIPKDIAVYCVKESFILELKHLLIAQGVSTAEATLLAKAVGIAIALGVPIGTVIDLAYGPYPIMKQRILNGIEFMEYTVATLGYANFIVVKTKQNNFEIWLVSYEKGLTINKLDKIPGKTELYYIGTYNQLPYIFVQKM